MRNARRHRHALACAGLLGGIAAATATAAAERYVFLGDSLVDNQNSYIATGLLTPDTVIPASPPYFEGRFSNGPNWTDRLAPEQSFYMDYYFSHSGCAEENSANGLAAFCGSTPNPGANPDASLGFAFGGAQAGTQELPHSAPGMLTVLDDLAAYQADGTVADLSGATFAILTGGNDYTDYVATGGAGASEQAVVDQTLDDIRTGLTKAAELGAGQALVLNLFDLDRVPSLRDYFSAEQLAQSGRLSTLHNAGLPAILADARRSEGLDVVLVDLHALYDDIFADPGRYGFANTTGACITSDAAHTATGECPDAAAEDATLFWDGQHPTTNAHGYIHELVVATVGAVDEDAGRLAALPDSALLMLRRVNTATRTRFGGHAGPDSRTDAAAPGAQRTFFVVAERGSGERAWASELPGYDYTVDATLVGVSYRRPHGDGERHAGAHVGYLSLDGDFDGGGSFDHRGVGLGVFAGERRAGRILGVQAGLFRLDVDDIERRTRFSVAPTAHGETSGWGATLELQAGVEHAVSLAGQPVGLSLTGRLAASHARLDGYREQSAEFLELRVEDSEISELRPGLEAAVWRGFRVGGAAGRAHAAIDYSYDLMDRQRSLDATLPSEQPVEADPRADTRGQFTLSGGVSLLAANGLRAGLSLAAAFDDGGERLLFAPRLDISKSF